MQKRKKNKKQNLYKNAIHLDSSIENEPKVSEGKEKKGKKKFHLPQIKMNLLTLLILIFTPILLFFIVAIPTIYIKTYNENKVTPFATDLKDIKKSDIIYGNKNTIKDFNFLFYCTKYNDGGTVEFKSFAYENENTRKVLGNKSEISVKVGLCSNWVKTDIYSSSRSRRVAASAKTALGSSSYYATYSISSVPNLPLKGKLPFINIKELTAYVYLTYTTTINGTNTTKRYVLEYDYEDYMVGKISIPDTRDQKVRVNNGYIQWQYEGDSNSSSYWRNIKAITELRPVDLKSTETEISWKYTTESGSEWKKLIDVADLTGAATDKSPQVTVESGIIKWKNDTDSTTAWRSIAYLNSLDMEVRYQNGKVEWKRTSSQTWRELTTLNSESKDYIEGVTPEVKVNPLNGSIQYRYGNNSWREIKKISDFLTVDVQISSNKSHVEWKYNDEFEWKMLVATNTLPAESDTAIIPPTEGGINKNK